MRENTSEEQFNSYLKSAIEEEIFFLTDESDVNILLKEIGEESLLELNPIELKKLKGIFGMVDYPMTVIYEPMYVDRVYRNSFYLYYAGKYNEIKRNCKRLSFFRGELTNITSGIDKNELQDSFVGTVVLKPLTRGYVGRTLLDPTKLKIKKCYLRTTEFEVTILGHHLSIKAFPFSSQDGETMTCAETTIWSCVEYFSHQYPEYRSILPSDIHEALKSISQERNLPSSGLPYDKVSALFKYFGFSPRICAVDKGGFDKVDIKRAFHYYVESGIPIAVGVSGLGVKHSIVCFGHTNKRNEVTTEIKNSITFTEQEYFYVDSADLYNEYVVMDDNQPPYALKEYDNLTIYEKAKVEIFVVPLYKRVFLEAQDVRKIFLNIMENEHLSFLTQINKLEEQFDKDNPLIFRTFLTSSRKFRAFRDNHESGLKDERHYQKVLYPKLVWVVEICTKKSYEAGFAYGEIVFDATALRSNIFSESVIMMRYFSNMGWRYPEEDLRALQERMRFPIQNMQKKFKMYINNLIEVGK